MMNALVNLISGTMPQNGQKSDSAAVDSGQWDGSQDFATTLDSVRQLALAGPRELTAALQPLNPALDQLSVPAGNALANGELLAPSEQDLDIDSLAELAANAISPWAVEQSLGQLSPGNHIQQNTETGNAAIPETGLASAVHNIINNWRTDSRRITATAEQALRPAQAANATLTTSPTATLTVEVAELTRTPVLPYGRAPGPDVGMTQIAAEQNQTQVRLSPEQQLAIAPAPGSDSPVAISTSLPPDAVAAEPASLRADGYAVNSANINTGVPSVDGGNMRSEMQQISAALGSERWGKEFDQQLLGIAMRGDKQVALHLNPRELGPLTVELKIVDNQAHIQFLSNHLSVRNAVEQAIPQLRDIFDQQGIALGDTGVSQHPEQRDRQAGQHTAGGLALETADADEASSADPVSEAMTTSTLDGRVNLYI